MTKHKREPVSLWVTRGDSQHCHDSSHYEIWNREPQWDAICGTWWYRGSPDTLPIASLLTAVVNNTLPSWRMKGGSDSIFELEMHDE